MSSPTTITPKSSTTIHQTCSICMDEICQDQPKTVLACAHTFHYSCLMRWNLQSRNLNHQSCPVCRDKIETCLHTNSHSNNQLSSEGEEGETGYDNDFTSEGTGNDINENLNLNIPYEQELSENSIGNIRFNLTEIMSATGAVEAGVMINCRNCRCDLHRQNCCDMCGIYICECR